MCCFDWVPSDCFVGWVIPLNKCDGNECYFSAHVEETPDVAGEDSFQAEEALPGDTAKEGKPSSKT